MLSNVELAITTCLRPYYLEQTLRAWRLARGFEQLRGVCIQVGASARMEDAMDVISDFVRLSPIPVAVQVDRPRRGPWQAMHDVLSCAFEDQAASFAIAAEEDILPADDILELFDWAKDQRDNDTLCVVSHSRCGTGWDGPNIQDSADADPAIMRRIPYFNTWGWGTWSDRWFDVIQPDWDGTGRNGGHDWNIQTRTMRGYHAIVPDASRTQHIGYREGMFATAETLRWTAANSFQANRDPVQFRMETDAHD